MFSGIFPLEVVSLLEMVSWFKHEFECSFMDSKDEKIIKTEGEAPRFLLSSDAWSSLMKHAKQVFELAPQMSIRIDLLHVYFIDMNV